MKGLLFALLSILLSIGTIQGQQKNLAAVHLSYQQAEVSYRHRFQPISSYAEMYAGVGNQDIDRGWDDLLTGLRLGYIFYEKGQNLLDVFGSTGVYLPNNAYYEANTIVCGLGVEYARSFGETKKHLLMFSVQYQYGQREYRQEYTSDLLSVSTIGAFRISPCSVSIGYGYHF